MMPKELRQRLKIWRLPFAARSAESWGMPATRYRELGRMTRKHRSLNYPDQPKMIATVLNDALATGDTVSFVKAIGEPDPCTRRDKGFPRDRTKARGPLYIFWWGHDAKH